MASTHPFKDHIQSTALGDLQKTVQEKPFSMPPIGNKTQHFFVVFCIKHSALIEIVLQTTIPLNWVKTLHSWLIGGVPGASEMGKWSFHLWAAISKIIKVHSYFCQIIRLKSPNRAIGWVTHRRGYIYYITTTRIWRNTYISIPIFVLLVNQQIVFQMKLYSGIFWIKILFQKPLMVLRVTQQSVNSCMKQDTTPTSLASPSYAWQTF